jgi:hypothetical protein
MTLSKLDRLKNWALANTFNDYRGGPEVVDIDKLIEEIDRLKGERE